MRKITLIFLLVFFGAKPKAQELYFPPQDGDWETVSADSLGWCETNLDSLKDFLEDKNSKAFIILKNGKIVVEWYYDGFTADSVWYWASAGKSLMATLVGIAQSENLLSIDDTASSYLGDGWTSMELVKEHKITIRNQLTMTTGLDYVIPDWNCFSPECLKYKADPNMQWFYHNAPYSLLRDVIEGAAEKDINTFFRQKIGNKIGMGGGYISTPNSYNLFFSTARNMAKFGLLTLAEGNWDGEVILSDKEYFSQMISPSQNINPSYGYLWWLNGQSSHVLPGLPTSFSGEIIPSAPEDMFAALGKNDQKIYVVPSQNLVVIRMGNNANDETFAVSGFDEQLWSRINSLSDCPVVASLESETRQSLQIYPNPTRNIFSLDSKFPIDKVVLLDMLGRRILATQKKTIDISGLPAGVYLAEIHFQNGIITSKKLLKE